MTDMKPLIPVRWTWNMRKPAALRLTPKVKQ